MRSLRKAVPALAGALLLMPAIALAGFYPEASESGTRNDLQPYQYSIQTSGLTGFKFDYQSSDHHVLGMATGQALVLDPIRISFRDNCAKDYYAWQYSHRVLPAMVINGFGGTARGLTSILLESQRAGYQPVLLGFSLKFLNGDHHVNAVVVDMENRLNSIWGRIGFWDKGYNDDPYEYYVAYALIPETELRMNYAIGKYTFTAPSSGPAGLYPGAYASGTGTEPISAAYPVMQGFWMQFSNAVDHHIDEIGASLTTTQARVWLNDTSDDDLFGWGMRYVDLN